MEIFQQQDINLLKTMFHRSLYSYKLYSQYPRMRINMNCDVNAGQMIRC